MEDRLCANCGTDIAWWVNKKKKKAYRLNNDDIVCSKKCLREYSVTFFNFDIEIIKGGQYD